jgi:hypothetical protein
MTGTQCRGPGRATRPAATSPAGKGVPATLSKEVSESDNVDLYHYENGK